jgi:integrase/recombinase XerD
MTELRQRMIEDMQLRNLAPATQRNYILRVARFARFYGLSPEHPDLEDIRQFHLHLLTDLNCSAEAVNQSLSALKFVYLQTLEMPWSDDHFPRARRAHKLPVILRQEEVVAFFAHVPSLRYRAALMTCYGAGLRVSEAVALKVSGIDSQRMLPRVEQGKGRKDRYAMRSPRLLAVLRVWWRSARPEGYPFPGWRTGQAPIGRVVADRLPRSRAARRHRQARHRAHVAPQLRHAHAGKRHGHPHRSDAAGPQPH